jgi:hypothetical protein
VHIDFGRKRRAQDELIIDVTYDLDAHGSDQGDSLAPGRFELRQKRAHARNL